MSKKQIKINNLFAGAMEHAQELFLVNPSDVQRYPRPNVNDVAKIGLQ